MRTARIAVLGVAVAAAGGAFFLLAQDDPEDAGRTVAAPAVPMTDVLVSVARVEQGGKFAEGSIRWVSWPKADVPENFVTRDEMAFAEELGLRRARRTIEAGEPVTPRNTVAFGDRGMLAAIMSPGMQAVSIAVAGGGSDSSGGFILPGDRVDIWSSADEDGGAEAKLVLADVRVLAINQTATQPEDTNALPGETITLEIAPEDVGGLVTARDRSDLSLALRSVFEGETSSAASRTDKNEVVVIRYGQGGRS